MTGLLNPKSSETPHLLSCMTLVMYLGHGIIHPVAVSFLFKPVFGIGLEFGN